MSDRRGTSLLTQWILYDLLWTVNNYYKKFILEESSCPVANKILYGVFEISKLSVAAKTLLLAVIGVFFLRIKQFNVPLTREAFELIKLELSINMGLAYPPGL